MTDGLLDFNGIQPEDLKNLSGDEHSLVLQAMIQKTGLILTKHVNTRTIFIKIKTTPYYLVYGYHYFPHGYIANTQTHAENPVLWPDTLIESMFH